MALPQQAVEKLSRSPERPTQGSYQNLLFFSGAIFLLALVVYLGLAFGYRPYLDSQVEELESQIQQFTAEIPPEEQEELIGFYSQIANIQGLLGGHTLATPALDLLSSTVSTGVFYTDAQLNSVNGELNLTGRADQLSQVNNQVALLEENEAVNRVVFNEVNSVEEGWRFTASVFLNSALLHPNSR